MAASAPFDELAGDAARWHQYLLLRALARGRDVLEIGFGEGAGAALLAESARSVVALDGSPAAVARARLRFAGPEFLAGALADRAPGSADLVLAQDPGSWAADPTAFHAAVCRVLRPEGLLILGGPAAAIPHSPAELLRSRHPHVVALALKPLAGAVMVAEPAAEAGPPRHFDRSADAMDGAAGLERPNRLLWLASAAPIPVPVASAFVQSDDAADRDRQWRLELARRDAENAVWLRKVRREREAALRRNEVDQQRFAEMERDFAHRLELVRREVEHRERLLSEAEARISEKDAHIAGMLASTSWRLTGPLRAVVARLRPPPPPEPAPPEELVALEAAPAPAPPEVPAGPESPAVTVAAPDRARQRQALGLDLPRPAWKVAVLLAAGRTAPQATGRCVTSAALALERSGLAGEVLLAGAPSGEGARSLRDTAGLSLAQAHNLLLRTAFAEGAEVGVVADPCGLFHPDCLRALLGVLAAHDGEAVVEASLFPEENPKDYDRETLRTGWASCQALAIGRRAFEELGGFDESFTDAGQDIDLSWRVRARGIPVLTAPHALFLLDAGAGSFLLESRRALLAGAVLLARKWGAPGFEAMAAGELAALGGAVPTARPEPVPEAWRAAADFAHGFAFAPARWSV